jgi:hypothetical protein
VSLFVGVRFGRLVVSLVYEFDMWPWDRRWYVVQVVDGAAAPKFLCRRVAALVACAT